MITNKIVRVIFREPGESAYKELNRIVGEQRRKGKTNSEEMQLLKSINNKIELIKQNPMCGDAIAKRLIPKEYDAIHLWRMELSHFWRMLYTLRGDQIEIVCFILDVLDHEDYNKKFGYRD